ncbi:hypothetical protein N7448_005406 [Penicillium atrosanguineum]|uniref:PLC-like phosphodiesterase n=1 Tax=Penicillium atrosanguineum TaxID=1132637 RepID=A0A9W9H3C8_9EURO|nr:uncharacterized protein N7443_009136 [Penicillium atrosanguineum]KAJ5126096.1 hypothetical protein N7526_008273 [Penicillium atrosanguineum]KAJ5136852.1 hypothetical protein N7448_005406 [Penicillium atrosanguineum]KAJ5293183.1 hypothetical protein N7443_009136 [Penicillium atrosanguineum]KAJ5302781.1 hypothetical protein N7476_009580 [Penicillium atrosanguineum]
MRFTLLALLPLALANPLNKRSTACNNSPDLCSKSYGEITHLGAHDSPFVRDSSTSNSIAGDQYYDTPTQLDAGVRMVTGQVHKSNSEWRLCHTSCDLLDAGLLSAWLGDIKSWLDDNPNEVVTVLLVNSDSASASDLNTEFETANITDYAYQPDSLTSAPSSWPTLETMINNSTRLVVFVASLTTDDSYPYLMDEWNFVWENPYEVTAASNFSCVPDRPSSVSGDTSTALSSNMLPLMNHFLYSSDLSSLGIEYPNASYVATTNAASGGTGNLGSTATRCKSAWSGRQPTFILVDFFNRGPAIDTVDNLNNVTNAVGRTSLTTSAAGSSSDGTTINNVFKGLVELAEAAAAGSTPTMGNWIWVGGNWGSVLGGGISL